MFRSMTRELGDKAKESAGQVGEKAGAMMHEVQEAAADWSHRAQQGFGAVQDAASSYIDQGQETVESLGRTMRGQFQGRPISALVAAAGIGVLLGVVLARR